MRFVLYFHCFKVLCSLFCKRRPHKGGLLHQQVLRRTQELALAGEEQQGPACSQNLLYFLYPKPLLQLPKGLEHHEPSLSPTDIAPFCFIGLGLLLFTSPALPSGSECKENPMAWTSAHGDERSQVGLRRREIHIQAPCRSSDQRLCMQQALGTAVEMKSHAGRDIRIHPKRSFGSLARCAARAWQGQRRVTWKYFGCRASLC